MSEYIPFLTPLLEEPQWAVDESVPSPSCPLEEEDYLEAHTGGSHDWKYLQKACRETYGLDLVAQVEFGAAPRMLSTLRFESTPHRALLLEGSHLSQFLIEHPLGLVLFDRYGEPDHLPALARPTLFNSLWRQAISHPEDTHRPDPAVQDLSKSAFEDHLSALLALGNLSDWHLEPRAKGYLSRVRIDGKLHNESLWSTAKGSWLTEAILIKAGLQEQPGRATEGRLEMRLADKRVSLRISLVPSLYGAALVVRFLYPDKGMLTLAETGMPTELRADINRFQTGGEGLCLVAGPTGSGKSTSLHALANLAAASSEKVLAVEDPVELVLDNVHHLSVGQPHGLTYAIALKAFLRQAPDCVLIGEIRDEETAAIAIQAARTGHRVLSSVHARDEKSLQHRFEDLGQAPADLRSVLQLVIHQRLVPLLCPLCRSVKAFPEKLEDVCHRFALPVPEGVAEAASCTECGKGYQGRRGLFAWSSLVDGQDVSRALLDAAWCLYTRKLLSTGSLLSFLPGELRLHFQICQ